MAKCDGTCFLQFVEPAAQVFASEQRVDHFVALFAEHNCRAAIREFEAHQPAQIVRQLHPCSYDVAVWVQMVENAFGPFGDGL